MEGTAGCLKNGGERLKKDTTRWTLIEKQSHEWTIFKKDIWARWHTNIYSSPFVQVINAVTSQHNGSGFESSVHFNIKGRK